jgi:hypothetical protein
MANRDKEKEKEESGGLTMLAPNEKYQKFFDKFAEVDTLEVAQWKIAHLLGYFCKKYKEVYNDDYTWKFNNPSPTKCFEVWQMNTLAARLSANPQILKDYIDWAYKNLVPKAKRRLTSISFMTKDEIVIGYKMNVLLAGKKNLNVDRSTLLPDNYRKVFEEIEVFVSNYGDLAFLSQMEQTPAMTGAFEKLYALGFDKDILDRIV